MSFRWKKQSLTRCDRCIKLKQKCTRETDGCQSCKRLELKCVYTKFYGKESKGNQNQSSNKFIHIFNLNRNTKDKDKSLSNKDIVMVYQAPNTINNVSINFDKEFEARKFKLRSTYNVLLNVLGGCVFDRFPNFKMTNKMYSLLNIAMTSSELAKDFNSFIELYTGTWLDDYEDLMQEAQFAYFKNLNSCFPLFLESTFESGKRSKVLMSIIFMCGLQFINKSKRASILHNHCMAVLLEYLNKNQFPPKLETLQIMLLINIGLKHVRGLAKFLGSQYESASHLFHQLGLHLDPPGKWDPNQLLERRLCFCALIQVSYGRMYVFQFPTPFCSYYYEDHIDLLSIAMKTSASNNDFGALLVAEAFYSQVMVFIEFSENIKIYEKDFEQFENFVQKCLIKLRKRTEVIYNRYMYLKGIKKIEEKDEGRFTGLVRLSYHSHCAILARHLLLKAEKSTDSPIYIDRIKKCKECLGAIISRLVEYIDAIPPTDRNFFHYGLVFYPLSFIILHFDIENPKNKRIFDLGIDILQEKDKSPLTSDSSPSFMEHINLLKSIKLSS